MSGPYRRWADTSGNRRFLKQTGISRHAGLFCACPLLDCCHNEMPGAEDRLACSSGTHIHFGSPASRGLYPWEPLDESWRDSPAYPFTTR